MDASTLLQFRDGLWLGRVDSAYGPIELVVDGTEDAPDPRHVAAIQAFMPNAGETIDRLRQSLPIPFLWHPIRLVVNRGDRVGIQFRRRLFATQRVLFADGRP